VYSLMLSTLIVGERPSGRQLLATATILLGIGSVYGAGSVFSPAWAAALVLLTPLFWQSSHVLALRVMPPLSPVCVTGARFIFAALVLTPLFMVAHPAELVSLAEPSALAAVVAVGVFAYLLSALTWYGAIGRLSLAWTTTLVVPGIPLVSIIFALILLGEYLSWREAFGIAIAIAGLLTLVFGTEAHREPRGTGAPAAVNPPLS